MRTVWYDKSCGAFYISERTIPDSVKVRGALEMMVSVSAVREMIVEAFKEGCEMGYMCCDAEYESNHWADKVIKSLK